MSYWVRLEQDGETVSVAKHNEGGTRAVGGTDVAELNVTYNYSEAYGVLQRVNPDFLYLVRDLNGMLASDTIPHLTWAVNMLGTRQHEDYWAPTPGNAGHALDILLDWAKQHPDAVFRVD